MLPSLGCVRTGDREPGAWAGWVLRQEGQIRGVVWGLRGTATGDEQPAEEKLPFGVEKETAGGGEEARC